MKQKLSVFITTYNNERTLGACLQAVQWADEIVVVDSFSSDRTPAIAQSFGCQFTQHEFLGYGKQKQLAMQRTSHEWVLLLDADEMLSTALAEEIQQLLNSKPEADGYEMPRQEQVFWTMASPHVRMNYYLRLFNKNKACISDMPIHAAPMSNGTVERLKHPFYHFGETDIHTKVDKINAYSSGLVEDKVAKGKKANPLILVFYPPLFFLRSYLFKRAFLNGWSGFIASYVSAFYAFLKYAKLYEYEQFNKVGESQMPPAAPKSPERWRETRKKNS